MSCKDVCIDFYTDGFSSEFAREEMRKAAKPHKCDECGEIIAVGQLHHYATGKCEGDFWSSRTCAPCHEIRKAFTCGGWVIEQLWTEIDEQIFPSWKNELTQIDCLAKLTTDEAIAKMRARYAEYVGDRS